MCCSVFSVLRCVARVACACSVWQCGAVCGSVLRVSERSAMRCSVLQCVAREWHMGWLRLVGSLK